MTVSGRAHLSGNRTMSHWTVKRRIILGFSAVMVIMIILSLIAHERLAAIGEQAADLRRDFVPSLTLADRLQAASIQADAGVHEVVVERDPQKMQQWSSYVQQKTTEFLDVLAQHDVLLTTPEERALAEATRAALAPYAVVTAEVLRLSADPRTKPQAATLLRDRLEPLSRNCRRRSRPKWRSAAPARMLPAGGSRRP